MLLFFFIYAPSAFSEEGLVWESFRLKPQIALSEIYSDNIYLENDHKRDEYITVVSPKLALDFALAPQNYITASYEGEYRLYKNVTNLKKETHQLGIVWSWTTTKDSTIETGYKIRYDSIQPSSINSHTKDFKKQEAFLKTLFKLSTSTEAGFSFNYQDRNFRNNENKIDDFSSESLMIGVAQKILPLTSVLLEYSYSHQDNNDFSVMKTNAIFTGLRWEPTAKLSGSLKMGYSVTAFEEFNDKNNNNNDSKSKNLVFDTDLTYTLSEVTRLKLNAFRKVVKSTSSARENGEYFISQGGILSAIYQRWDPLTLSVLFSYYNNAFKKNGYKAIDDDLINEEDNYKHRKDDLYISSFKADYVMGEGLTSSFIYQNKNNHSNVEQERYRENRFELKFTFKI